MEDFFHPKTYRSKAGLGALRLSVNKSVHLGLAFKAVKSFWRPNAYKLVFISLGSCIMGSSYEKIHLIASDIVMCFSSG